MEEEERQWEGVPGVSDVTRRVIKRQRTRKTDKWDDDIPPTYKRACKSWFEPNYSADMDSLLVIAVHVIVESELGHRPGDLPTNLISLLEETRRERSGRKFRLITVDESEKELCVVSS